MENIITVIVNEIVDNSSDDDEELLLLLIKQKKKSRTCIIDYMEVINKYSVTDFKAHFRLERTTVEIMIQEFGKEIHHSTAAGGRPTSPAKQILVSLWMLANQEVYRSIADRFNITISTAWEYVHRIVDILVKNVKNYIKWPENMEQISYRFQRKSGFPNVVGAIDGTHIPIASPKDRSNSYLNRKQFHSLILQGVCDADYVFIDCFAGCPGSIHDARVYRMSPIKSFVERTLSQQQHLLGDSAYTNSVHLITPYRDNGYLTAKQKKYNFIHSSTRVSIEQCFGLLKGRFRILKFVNVLDTKFIPNLIMACCILHNICMKNNDTDVEIAMDEPMDNTCFTDLELTTALSKRDHICNLIVK